MPDTRELILERLLVLAKAVPNVKDAWRNRGLRKNSQRPCIVIMDADETSAVSQPSRGRQVGFAPQIVRMRPEIYILMDEMRPTNQNETDENVGALINQIKHDFMVSMTNDSTLISLLGSNGGMVYDGLATDLKSGARASGEMKLDFTFTYPVKL